MRMIVLVAVAANAVGMIIIMVHGERQGWHRVDPAFLLFLGIMGLSFGTCLWSLLNIDNGRLGRLFSLWLKAKEHELDRRAGRDQSR